MSFWIPTIHTFENKEQVSDLVGSVNVQKNQEILSTIVDKRTIDEINYNAQFWDSLFNNLSKINITEEDRHNENINLHIKYIQSDSDVINNYANIIKLSLLPTISCGNFLKFIRYNPKTIEALKWTLLSENIMLNWPTYIIEKEKIVETVEEIFKHFSDQQWLSDLKSRRLARLHGIKYTSAMKQEHQNGKEFDYAWTTREWYFERARAVDKKLNTWWTLEKNMQDLINKSKYKDKII